MSKIADFKAQVWTSLPLSQKQKARDAFIKILKENNCTVTKVKELGCEWEFNPDHKEVKKILKKTRPKGRDIITSLSELTDKEKQLYLKRQHIMSERWKTKAQYKVIMSLHKQAEQQVK